MVKYILITLLIVLLLIGARILYTRKIVPWIIKKIKEIRADDFPVDY